MTADSQTDYHTLCRLVTRMSTRNKIAIGLALTLLVEAYIFSRSFHMFFCGDSLFYLSRVIDGFSEALRRFASVDDLGQYRPLTYLIFSFFHRFFKLDPYPYHFVPLAAHMLNTVLVYLLLERLLSDRLAAFSGAFFFGVHTVAFFITYDMTFLPDFTYGMLYVASLILFFKHMKTGRRIWYLSSFCAFLLCLLAKETAVTLPANLLLCLMLFPALRDRKLSWRENLILSLRRTYPFLALFAAHLALLYFLKGGQLFPERADHPYYVEFRPQVLLNKVSYLRWALNLPDGLALRRHALPQLAAASALFPILLACAFYVSLGLFRARPAVLCGLAWFVVALGPVLFLATRVMHHNLYVPLIGMAMAVGAFASWMYNSSLRAHKLAAIGLLGYFLSASSLAVYTNSRRYLQDSWVSNGSAVARNCLEDLKRLRPELARGTTLYFLKSMEKDLWWYFDDGRMFNVFYNDSSIKTLFADRGHKLPQDYLENDNVIILRYVNRHVYDVTEQYKREAGDISSLRLANLLSDGNISFDISESYPRYDRFDTPNGKPAFLYYVTRGGQAYEAMITIAGARVRFELPPITPGTKLSFAAASVLPIGDGVEGRIYFERQGELELLYLKFITPPKDEGARHWHDELIDLSRFAGESGALIFEAASGPNHDTIGDWLAWVSPKLHCNPQGLQTSLQPTWLLFTPSYVRAGEYVIVTVGNASNMTLSCKYRHNDGEVKVIENWITTNAAGQYVFQAQLRGRFDVVAIKNVKSRDWVPVSATYQVQ